MNELAIIKSSTLTDIADAIRAKKGIAAEVSTVSNQSVVLPNGYKQREYIESSGEQYIDTEYKFTSNKIKIYMEIENLNATSGASLCGVESSAGYAAILYSYNSNETFTLHMGVTAYITTIQVPKDGAFHTVEIETFGDGTGQISVDGNIQSFSFAGNVNGTLPLYVGALSTDSGAADFSKQRTKVFKMWDNDTLVRNYVPCTKSDGIAGLYDTVNLKYNGNAGNGLFVAGEEVESGESGSSEFYLIPTSSMASEILSIETSDSGVILPTLSNPASASKILSGYEAINSSGEKITGTIESIEAQNIVPSTSDHTINSGKYLAGNIVVKGDSNLQSSNIKDGVTIFGIDGSYEGTTIDNSVDLSGVTATASDVLYQKVFVNSDGEEVTGTIVAKTSSDLTASGATVTVPAGYYASQASKSVSTATHEKPTVTSVSSGGVVNLSHTQSAGYVSAGTTTNTYQLTTQAAKTVTPSTSNQTAVASGRYTTGAVTVAGDSDLVASNIKKGVTIFGVTGTYVPTFT